MTATTTQDTEPRAFVLTCIQPGPAGLMDGSVSTLARSLVQYVAKDQVSHGTTQLSPGGTVDNAAVFVFEDKELGDLLLQAGVRYDHHEVEGEASKTASPSASVVNTQQQSYDVVTGAASTA